MNLPQFVLADNSNFPDAIFVIHLDYPRFIINLEDGDLTFLEPVDESDENELEEEMEHLIDQAQAFYDKEISFYEEQDI
ncbi:hypothetical protein [Avrilella dinanensis]|uniref:Uncharacterized protein n=1 Tax=Avrilella dinanensis TaxID=2008672 RepID=A0A2M9R434_9FLAO|nr:hypothetical protein [Avrilella dinanensis]PJR03505.1 hypothetical protein CDL10_02490 [Avrilella dinanensis]